MNRLQWLLSKLAEEASEVSQISLKTSQFGPDEVMPGQPLTNFQRTHGELNDLLAIVEVLNDEYNFDFKCDLNSLDRNAIELKKQKLEKYYRYSVSLGLVKDE